MTSRRSFLKGFAASALAAPFVSRALAAPAWSGDPFQLGVAAGAPSADGFVLWTKLAPEPMLTDPIGLFGMNGASLPVAYEIASDDRMRNVVRKGEATADAELGYSVHEVIT